MTETVQVALITAIATLVSAALATTATVLVTQMASRAERREARRADARRVVSQLISRGRMWARMQGNAVEYVSTKATREEAKAAWDGISASDSAMEMADHRDAFHALVAEAILLIDDEAVQAALQNLRGWFAEGASSPLYRVLDSFDDERAQGLTVGASSLEELANLRLRIDAVEQAASRVVRVRL